MVRRPLAADGSQSGAGESVGSRPHPGRPRTWPGRLGFYYSYCYCALRACALLLLLAVLLGRWPVAAAMRPDRVRELRQETVDMFYHGFDNYMEVAFPEDEVWPRSGPFFFFFFAFFLSRTRHAD